VSNSTCRDEVPDVSLRRMPRAAVPVGLKHGCEAKRFLNL